MPVSNEKRTKIINATISSKEKDIKEKDIKEIKPTAKDKHLDDLLLGLEYKELQFVKGVGPKCIAALVKNSQIQTSKYNLLTYFPRDYKKRIYFNSVREIIKNKHEFVEIPQTVNFNQELTFKREASLFGRIEYLKKYRNQKLEIFLRDQYNEMFVLRFFQYVDSISKTYSQNMGIIISGTPTFEYNKLLSFSHPDEILILNTSSSDSNTNLLVYNENTQSYIPIYKISDEMSKARINNKKFGQIIKSSFSLYSKYINNLSDVLPEYILKQSYNVPIEIEITKQGKLQKLPSKIVTTLPSIQDTINILHFPETENDIYKARYRMKFEEALIYQLAINVRNRQVLTHGKGIIITEKSKSARNLYDNLTFQLSPDQRKVLWDFAKDFSSGKPMSRLLQGDVGSGKTIVSILTMLMVIDAGYQVAMLAPTELLAEQHYHTISKLLKEFVNVKVVQLVGGLKKSLKKLVLNEISNGTANIIVGTHSLFQSDVEYKNLGLIVIDEQHRFGVMQRGELIELAKESIKQQDLMPHVLYMTATPIPRTLEMTAYGDLDISIIKTMPKNRIPVKTKIVFEKERRDIFNFINIEILKGRQVYIVYPLVEKSEKLELKSAVEHYELIKQVFPHLNCGLLHGQMQWYEKEEVMQKFLNKEYQILVATTVVEVGIDVPNATIMLIENAERFGLSQLHQLRGRVGRGMEQSYCFLMTKDNFLYKFSKTENAEEEKIKAVTRLKTMQETNDGFKIAEVDAKIRGIGDILGTKQAGMIQYKYINLTNNNDVKILEKARTKAREILKKDENLTSPIHKLLKEQVDKKIDFFLIA